MYHHLMVDVESLSLEPNAAIIQFAAVPFEPASGHARVAKQEETLDLRIWPIAYPRKGYDVDPRTMDWWDQQDPDIRKSVFSGMLTPAEAATKFIAYLEDGRAKGLFPADAKDLRIWSRNILFDLPVIKNWLEEEGCAYPFHYRAHREVYQELDGIPEKVIKEFSHNPAWHNAVCDALYQARQVCEARHWRATGDIITWTA